LSRISTGQTDSVPRSVLNLRANSDEGISVPGLMPYGNYRIERLPSTDYGRTVS